MFLLCRLSDDRLGMLSYLPDIHDPLLHCLVDLVFRFIVAVVLGEVLLGN